MDDSLVVVDDNKSMGGMGMATVRPMEDNNVFQNLIRPPPDIDMSLGPEGVRTKMGFLGNFFSLCWEMKAMAGSQGLFSKIRRPSRATSPDPLPGASGALMATILSIKVGTLDLSLCRTST
jgi:hypothetical protein